MMILKKSKSKNAISKKYEKSRAPNVWKYVIPSLLAINPTLVRKSPRMHESKAKNAPINPMVLLLPPLTIFTNHPTANPAKGHEIVLNVTNSYSGKFIDEYGAGAVTADGKLLKASNHPLSYLINWNGNMFDGLISTRWATGIYNQAKGYTDKMVTLGQSLNLPKFQIYFDYMGAWEGLDRLKIATAELGGGYQTDVRYQTFVAKANWQFAEGFNLMAKGMYETTHTKDLGTFRKSYGYIGALEYYPLKDQDLRFFLAYVGRKFKYSRINTPDYNTNRIELGFMFRIKAY